MQRLTGCIQFVNVSFHYPSRKMVPILKNLNFSITANEVVAIVGVSGSGKSTLINLLLRLYEPISGEVSIKCILSPDFNQWKSSERDGHQVAERKYWICWAEIKSAAMFANAHEFVSSLPSGYDTIIDDNLLSGGQKQRVAIARAVIRDPAILILDEATSALDAESESYITEILHSMRKDSKTQRTIIIIAHRLSTLKSADRVMVMDKGQIIEVRHSVTQNPSNLNIV
ncbi:hypothetical protein RD792_004283 [Penstemon davidsonii]|uniref:ABC transporter domain-containing protein n=1 Tax=Penstemon davidsonii TaxID=160366 RepID=A0ABR0DHL0_9LAMI|nr:hypothetical protein RD792_004283 [Penstemon davidsonii]